MACRAAGIQQAIFGDTGMGNSNNATWTRRSFGGAALGLAAAGILAGRVEGAAQSKMPGLHKGMGLVADKRIDAGDLNVGYADLGPEGGSAVILFHGWPYDINAFAEVAPLLAERGHRVIVPHLRGYGSTRFLSDDTMRNGQ